MKNVFMNNIFFTFAIGFVDAAVKVKVKSSVARSLPVENLQPQNVWSIINYTCSNLLK